MVFSATILPIRPSLPSPWFLHLLVHLPRRSLRHFHQWYSLGHPSRLGMHTCKYESDVNFDEEGHQSERMYSHVVRLDSKQTQAVNHIEFCKYGFDSKIIFRVALFHMIELSFFVHPSQS